MIILSAKNICKQYANHTALDNVSIDIEKGQVFGLLGPNGAGKTSLIRIINQITGPDSGELFFEGEKLSPRHIERIGYLPEERGLYKKMQVGEQALYLCQLKGPSKKEALKRLKYWFEKFEITAWWNKKVEELSKGMQQKVQFIVTVLHEPSLLILDEPFSGFDPINANLLKQEILHLKEKGTTIVFSTHNMESVEQLCDHVVLINKAKKIVDGSVKNIRKEFKSNTYNIDFAGSMIGFTNALWTCAELISSNEEDEIKTATIKLSGNATINQVLEQLLPVVKILGLKELIPSMNDIFISKVSQTDTPIITSHLTE
jgi:ABC-2 type transport system ATP-binding protein